ncbi:MAG: type 4a pilus biogenesis protein PilO [Phycisphaerales bacterium]
MSQILAHLKYLGVLVILGVVGGGVFIWPAYTRSVELHSTIASLNERKELGQDEHTRIENAATELKSLNRRYAEDLRVIPDSSDAPWLYENISADVEALPLRLTNLTWGQEAPAGTKMSLGVNIEASGAFDGVYELLQRIEQWPRLVRVNELTIKRGKDPAALDELTATVKLRAFYSPSADGANGGSEGGDQ